MRIILLLFALTLLPGTNVLAAELDLYSGEAAVADQSDAERKRALPFALGNVIQKISGLRNFDEHPVLEQSLGRASSIVLSFHYRNINTMLTDGSLQKGLNLVAAFSQPDVDDLARSLELPLWQAKRLPLEIWLIVDDGVDRRIQPVEINYVRDSMGRVAAMRGLPVIWPTADEEGMYPVDSQVLWGGYAEELAIPGKVGAMILAARREGSVWSVRANISYNDENQAWRMQDIDLQSALTESLQQAVDQIAALNVIAASDLGLSQYELTVTGVASPGAYQRCLNSLQAISTVDRVTLVSAKASRVTFRLDLNALPRYLEASLAGGGVIEVEAGSGEFILVEQANNDR